MHFNRVHVEVTNVCGLACSFCPPKTFPSKNMSHELFEKTLKQLKPYTKTLAFHIMGDPLTLSNLDTYLDLAQHYGFEVELTTSGYYLKLRDAATLFHPAVRQLNISLNSYNKNALNMSFDEYIDGVISTCKTKLECYSKPFINLRLWNLDEGMSEHSFNEKIFKKLEETFGSTIELKQMQENKERSLRLASKVILHFDSYFQWPNIQSKHKSDGKCYGLQSHIGVLANGTVVPCCLDAEGVIALGNIEQTPLKDILNSTRAQAIVKGFKEAKAVEELCQKCSYKERFN